jgi:hypothetical protein
MNRSQEIGELAKALVKAQAEMKNPAFDTTNPHFKSRFASLAAVRNAVLPIFNKHGIFVTQDVTTVEGGVSCVTVLMHESGQFWEFGPLNMPATKQDAQGYGSATTYAKRYALQSVSGVVGDDDDDGNAASHTLGWRDNSGRPDTSNVDPDRVAAFVESFKTALLNSDVNGIMEMHHQLRTEAELYTAVSDKLTSKQRSDLRKIITENKEAA